MPKTKSTETNAQKKRNIKEMSNENSTTQIENKQKKSSNANKKSTKRESKKDSDDLISVNPAHFAEDDVSEAAAAIIEFHDAEFKKIVKFDDVQSICSLVE